MSEHPESVPRYPLQWPLGWPRKGSRQRKSGTFRSGRAWIGIQQAVRRLEIELDRLGAADVTLSSNLRTRLSGDVVANAGEPADPGVAIYFRFKGRATVFACDGYTRVAENIAAIANHIKALRAIKRYGVGSIEQAIAGYRALPADTAADWRAVFGFNGGPVSAEQLNAKFKEMARDKHPDTGGTEEGMAHLNRAREYALAELLS